MDARATWTPTGFRRRTERGIEAVCDKGGAEEGRRRRINEGEGMR